MKKILLTFLALVSIAFVGITLYVASRQNLKYDDTPLPAVTASTDSAVVARGHYVVRSVALCGACHGNPAMMDSNMAGAEVPLSGGFEWVIPPGKIRARNLTPDATGIGNFTDGQIARALRFGVGHDGRALLPFMEMQGLSDEDLVAVVSYLRAQPPVQNPVPMHQYTLLGNVVKATVLSKPVGPKETPLQTSPAGATVDNGKYLAGSVANCWACHTQRDFNTGALTNALYSGSNNFPDDLDHTKIWSPPNLTSDPKTGRLAKFTEDEFVARFRAGRIIPGSPMPWPHYARMTDDDLRAIYRFLKTLPAVENEVGPAVRDAAKKS